MHVLHKIKIFMHVLIALVCTETKLESIKPLYHQIHLFIRSAKIFFVLVQHTALELWVLYDAVEMKFAIVISLLK